ncbi:hypothetical protein ABT160_15740 [Streptomyces sp. NPDC001941]|uniref:hypothetical protein n=1 Tax=Streptomyces sp. NPDC001941 TaxID=3154659 RepID=UPI003329D6B5
MVDFVGSGRACHTDALLMLLGAQAPSAGLAETLTGSPFGVHLLGGARPFFDPYGWSPEHGLDAAARLLGWRCERGGGGREKEALERLRAVCARGPVLVGPVDAGGLEYLPQGQGLYCDHYVVVLAVEGDRVLLHDPHGHPYATVPVGPFMAAWRAREAAVSPEPYVLRWGFVRYGAPDPAEAVRTALPEWVSWLGVRADLPMPEGTLANRAAVERLAAMADDGLTPLLRKSLTHYWIGVAARRLAGAAGCLRAAGLREAAAVAAGQAWTLGALQHPLVRGDDRTAAELLRRLAPTYERMHEVLSAG